MWQSFSKNGRVILIAFVVLLVIILFSVLRDESETIKRQEAIKIIETEEIQKAVIAEPYLYLHTKDSIYKVVKDAVEMESLYNKTLVEYKSESAETLDILMFIFIIGFTLYIVSVIKESRVSHENMINEQREDSVVNSISNENIMPQLSQINFSDVAGVEDVKEELEEIIDFLRNPDKYRNFDIRLPKGVLLVGPPGVGKTLIAKAVAGEADVPFFYQSGASFVHIYVGMGAKRVSELFNKAKQMAPSIIFIDEIDAVGKRRGGMNSDEREATLNQLLTEMDGFEESSGVMVIAATNKIEVLDDALLRAGRFDRRVHISLPNNHERASTLELYLKGKKNSIDIAKIAHMTVGFNSAALSTLINEAALNALRLDKTTIDNSDIEAVKEKVLLGKHRIQPLNENEQKIQALYQAAKAVTASWLEVEYDKIGLLSSNLIPHHNEILSKTALENELKVLLSGRMVTKKHYGELFTNSRDDIKKAKILAQEIIEEYAMSDEYLPTAIEIERLMQRATEDLESLLSKLDPVVDKVKDYLLENESITHIQTKKILDDLF